MKNNMEMTVRRLMKVVVPEPNPQENSAALVMAAAKNAQSLGFAFSPELTANLTNQPADFVKTFYVELVGILKELAGDDVKYEPFYPNFPSQVAEASDAELFVNAILHYLTRGKLFPDYPKDERFPLLFDEKLKEVGVCSEAEFLKIFTNLLSSAVPISEKDKEDVRWFVENVEYASLVPDEIPIKETKAFFGALLLEKGDAESASKLFGTATDVLRLLASVSNADVSLSKKVRFRKLRRPERRFFMDLLTKVGPLDEDMFRNRPLWITAGEIIHPGEFAKTAKYGAVVASFATLRSNDKPAFFGGKLEKAYASNDWKTALELLSTRPGDFARNLDRILRIPKVDANAVVSEFSKVADKVSARVLWQAKSHFDHRGENDKRAFFPKGIASKCRVVDGKLPKISDDVRKAASEACMRGILAQYAKRPSMGRVYVDPEFRNYAAPFSQRASSSGFMQIAKGSRLPLGESRKIVRPFIWWTNAEDGDAVDVDLAVSFLDEKMNFKGEVSYCSVRNEELRAYHSGDIVDGGPFGGDGVCEFVDFEPDYLLEKKVRYAVIQVHEYSERPFCETPCFFGWMERDDADSGEVFEPRTVRHRVALTSDAMTAIPAIVDLKTREVVWADMNASSGIGRGGNNVYSNLVGTTATAWAILHWEKPSLYDLVVANVRARGTLVADRESADAIFSNDPTKPTMRVVETDDDGNEVVREVERDVPIKDAFDLAYYMGEVM